MASYYGWNGQQNLPLGSSSAAPTVHDRNENRPTFQFQNAYLFYDRDPYL